MWNVIKCEIEMYVEKFFKEYYDGNYVFVYVM